MKSVLRSLMDDNIEIAELWLANITSQNVSTTVAVTMKVKWIYKISFFMKHN